MENATSLHLRRIVFVEHMRIIFFLMYDSENLCFLAQNFTVFSCVTEIESDISPMNDALF